MTSIMLCTLAILSQPVSDRPVDDTDVPQAKIVQPLPASTAGPELIDRAVQGMKSAQSRLSDGQTGAATQNIQRQVLADLDELLKAPPKPNSSNPSGSGGGGEQQDAGSSPSNSPQGRDGQASDQQKTASGAQPKPGSQQDRSQADDSEERAGPRRSGVAAPLPRRRLEVDVWGHLPEKVREQLLNGYGERMVPQYESLVRKFYESLADTAASDERP